MFNKAIQIMDSKFRYENDLIELPAKYTVYLNPIWDKYSWIELPNQLHVLNQISNVF